MKPKRIAILIFSKFPHPGKVKTRLTTDKEGILSHQQAAHLYHCMLFDVVETSMDACTQFMSMHPEINVDLFISSPGHTQSTQMKKLFDKSGKWPYEIEFISDEGASFDEHYNCAFKNVCESSGAQAILSYGADMPALTPAPIIEGLEKLTEALVSSKDLLLISADQMMGVSMVGWPSYSKMNHTGIYYNQDGYTVLPAYIKKAKNLGVNAAPLPDVPDLDTMLDLYHNASLLTSNRYYYECKTLTSYAYRTLEYLEHLNLAEFIIAPNQLGDSREDIDLG